MELSHDVAVRAVLGAIGEGDCRQLVRGARAHAIGDALPWLKDGLRRGPLASR